MESNVDIFIENEEEKLFIIDCPNEIKYSDFKNIIEEKNITEIRHYYILFNGITYFDDDNLNNILKLDIGDKLTIVNERMSWCAFFSKFHENYNFDENDLKTEPLTGLLKLILVKYISSFIIDTNNIKSKEIQEIFSELKERLKFKENIEYYIKLNIEETQGNNILIYSNYISSIINDNIINQLLNLFPSKEQNEIKKFWGILSKYQEFNKLFQPELFKAIKKSYFDYSLIGISLYEQFNIKKYLKSMKDCSSLVVKYLFHVNQIDPVCKVIRNDLLYSRKPYYGMGIYFSDMLDYISFFYEGNNYNSRKENLGSVLPVNSIFSCISAEVYYIEWKKRDINDSSFFVSTLDHFPSYEEIKLNHIDKMVDINGVHFARVAPFQEMMKEKSEIIEDIKKGKFLGNEYVITELSQILPLYGLTFKRNEYFVIWRDNHFKDNNEYSDFLKERKLFIYEYAKMNVYFEDSLEKALEIIKRKKYNKIILISNIGLDKSGKKFVEVARKILGFNVVVLFFSQNKSHFSWIQNFPNVLYTNNASFYKDYIMNYNEKGLNDLKNKVEKEYKINLKFDNDLMKFPKFINTIKYDKISFRESSPYFKKVLIKNKFNNSILCMKNDTEPCFKSADNLDIRDYFWYVTLIDNEITLYSNENYLGVNVNLKKATREEFMKIFKFEKLNENDYLIYFNDKNNVLTVNENNAIIQKESNNKSNQTFKLVEEIEIE